MSDNICFIDFETTGTSLLKDYPIEIGAVVLSKTFSIINEFHSFIRPNNSFAVSEKAFEIHRIDEQKILNFPSEVSVLAEMNSQLGSDFRFAAWNMSFDVAFFKILCYRNNFDSFLDNINYRHIDVQTISFLAKMNGLIDSKINSLADFCNFLGLSRSANHNALEDVKLLVEVYKYLIYKFRENRVRKIL